MHHRSLNSIAYLNFTDSPIPFIQCPGNMAVTLAPQERRAYVPFSRPKSNMDWFRFVIFSIENNQAISWWIPIHSGFEAPRIFSSINHLIAVQTWKMDTNQLFWVRYVDSEPAWAKQLGGELDVGFHTIVFRVRSPVSDLTASCNFTIEIFGKFIHSSTYSYSDCWLDSVNFYIINWDWQNELL